MIYKRLSVQQILGGFVLIAGKIKRMWNPIQPKFSNCHFY
jgi:hypothetical protein